MRKDISDTNKPTIEVGVPFVLPPNLVASVAGVNVATVKKVREGKRGTGPKAKKVKVVDVFLQQGMSTLIQQAKELVHI